MRKKKNFLMFFILLLVFYVNNVKAYDEIQCRYDGNGSDAGKYLMVNYIISDGQYSISKCQYLSKDTGKAEYNCSDYRFDTNGQKSISLLCPGDISVNNNSKLITWKKSEVMMFTPIAKRIVALSCYDYDRATCEAEERIETKTKDMEKNFSCVWVTKGDTPGYCNVDNLQYVKCGDAFDIPEQAPRIMSFAINLLKIGTPIILILTGIVTLIKALAASKDDEIKKAQSSLIRKVIASALVFSVIMIVQFVILKVADSDDAGGVKSCLSCFLNNDCNSAIYFKTKVGDEYVCHLVSDPTKEVECGENANNTSDSGIGNKASQWDPTGTDDGVGSKASQWNSTDTDDEVGSKAGQWNSTDTDDEVGSKAGQWNSTDTDDEVGSKAGQWGNN